MRLPQKGEGEPERSAAGPVLQGLLPEAASASWETGAEWALLKALVSGEASSRNIQVHGGKEIKKYELTDGVQILILKNKLQTGYWGNTSPRKCSVPLATAARADSFL